MPAQFDLTQRRPRLREEVQAGFAALKQGDIEGAREHFIALLEEDPDLASAHLGLGRVFAAEGDWRKALEHFQEALALKPDLAPAQLFAAEAREKLGEVDEAIADYDQAISMNPSMPLGYMRKARLLGRENRDEARRVLSEAVRHNPQDGGVRLALAQSLARSGEMAQAEAEFHRAIELQPDNWMAHFGLGAALLQARQFGPARDALTRAAKLAADKPMVHQALGAALTGLGDHARAVKAYDDALKLDPTNHRAMIGAAMARSAAGRHQEAIELLRRFGRVGNRLPPVQKALGDVYLAMGRPADAVEIYRALILGSKRMTAGSPDLVDLAQAGDGVDAAEQAGRLQQALGTAMAAISEQRRADPKALRDRLLARRQRQTG